MRSKRQVLVCLATTRRPPSPAYEGWPAARRDRVRSLRTRPAPSCEAIPPFRGPAQHGDGAGSLPDGGDPRGLVLHASKIFSSMKPGRRARRRRIQCGEPPTISFGSDRRLRPRRLPGFCCFVGYHFLVRLRRRPTHSRPTRNLTISRNLTECGRCRLDEKHARD